MAGGGSSVPPAVSAPPPLPPPRREAKVEPMLRTRASQGALPDLSRRTALVTGAGDGVGVEIARGLASAGADLVLPVRNRDKGARVIDMIRTDSPDAAVGLRDLDLSRLASVDALA